MPTSECKLLLDACGPAIYARNAFRLFGADVDIKGRRIKRQERDLHAALELDELADEYSKALRPDPLPTREELAQAGRALTDAQQRFIQEFFWLWPLEWGKSASDEALALIRTSTIDEAKKRWTQIAKEGNGASPVARHNLAVLAHWQALDGEQRILATAESSELTKKQRKRLAADWGMALTHWERLVADEAFWSTQADRIRDLDDPRLTTGFLHRFRQSLPIALHNINAEMAIAYCRRDMYARARDHVQMMKAITAGNGHADAGLRRVTAPFNVRLDHAIETATSQLSHNRTEGKQRCVELYNTVRGILNTLKTLLGRESQEYVDTCDRVAEGMLRCQIAYGNETEDWDSTLELLNTLSSIDCSAVLKAKIEDNKATVEANIASPLSKASANAPAAECVERALQAAQEDDWDTAVSSLREAIRLSRGREMKAPLREQLVVSLTNRAISRSNEAVSLINQEQDVFSGTLERQIEAIAEKSGYLCGMCGASPKYELRTQAGQTLTLCETCSGKLKEAQKFSPSSKALSLLRKAEKDLLEARAMDPARKTVQEHLSQVQKMVGRFGYYSVEETTGLKGVWTTLTKRVAPTLIGWAIKAAIWIGLFALMGWISSLGGCDI
jgi:tetratricopeptide (TPR) repeat protein